MRTLFCSATALLVCLLPTAGAEAAKVFAENQVKGSYAYSFQGEIVSGPFADVFGAGPIVATGIINFHWDGYYNSETQMWVDADGQRTYSANGVTDTNGFECDLTLNSDGTGNGTALCVVVPTPAIDLPDESFAFVLEDNGKGFRYVGTTDGISVLGSGRTQ